MVLASTTNFLDTRFLQCPSGIRDVKTFGLCLSCWGVKFDFGNRALISSLSWDLYAIWLLEAQACSVWKGQTVSISWMFIVLPPCQRKPVGAALSTSGKRRANLRLGTPPSTSDAAQGGRRAGELKLVLFENAPEDGSNKLENLKTNEKRATKN